MTPRITAQYNVRIIVFEDHVELGHVHRFKGKKDGGGTWVPGSVLKLNKLLSTKPVRLAPSHKRTKVRKA